MKKSLLAAILLPLCLLGKPAIAEGQEQRHDLWVYFDPVVSNSDIIEINNFYESESIQEKPDFVKSWAVFYNNLYINKNIPISSVQASEANTLLKNVKNGAINSYPDLINSSKNLSEMQKLVMFSAMGNSAYSYGYDVFLGNGEVISQESFFKKLQNVLNLQKNVIGVCRHIASNLEQLANDSGLRTSAVTGMASGGVGHAYDISKLENATAIWDGGNIIIAQTKNIEKALEIYQLSSNSVMFQHKFFEDSKLKYSLITRDGKNYLDFVDYKPSTETIEDTLFNNLSAVMPISLNFTEKDCLSAGELSVYGLFVKMGKIKGDSLSPMKDISLFQSGYKGSFSSQQLPGFSIKQAISLVYGDIQYKNKGDLKSKDFLLGFSGDMILSYNQKAGLNLSSRMGYNVFINRNFFDVFYDFPIEFGASYKMQMNKSSIEPYFISQFGILPSDLGTFVYVPQITEIKSGVALNLPVNKNSTFSLNPYYSKKLGEQEFGAGAKLETEYLEMGINGYASQAAYDFAPERAGIDIGASISLGNSKISLNYKDEMQNYDGETTNNSSFSINGKIKF